jgi:molecular chaperone DnaK (HSP70)
MNNVETVLRNAKCEPKDIEHVVLSGGCCNMPKIVAMLKAHFARATVHHR